MAADATTAPRLRSNEYRPSQYAALLLRVWQGVQDARNVRMGRDDIARSPRIGLFSLTSPASAFLSNCCFLVRLAGTHKESFRLITQHTDAVVFLGAQSRKHDSVLKRGYITLWPKLPAFLKSKLKQPTNAVPIRVKALGALRRMRPGFTKLEPGMTILIEALNDPSEEVRS